MSYYERFEKYDLEDTENSDVIIIQRRNFKWVIRLLALYFISHLVFSEWIYEVDSFLNKINLCNYGNWCNWLNHEFLSINTYGRFDFVCSLIALRYLTPLIGDIVFENHRFLTAGKSFFIYLVYAFFTYKFFKCLVPDNALVDVYCSFLTIFFLELIRYNKHWKPDLAQIFGNISIWLEIKKLDFVWFLFSFRIIKKIYAIISPPAKWIKAKYDSFIELIL